MGPHTLREAAILAAEDGEPEACRALFEASLSLAREQGASLEEAVTLHERGRVARLHAWDDWRGDLDRAASLFHELGVDPKPLQWGAPPVPLEGHDVGSTPGLADRFSAAVECGRRIASALSREDVHHEVLTAASELLRGERAALLQLDDAGEWRAVAGDLQLRPSISLIASAMARGAAHVDDGLDMLSVSESIVASGVRSALCVPIKVDNAVSACLYVVHRQVTLFAQDDTVLADYVARLAGAALENARNFTTVLALVEEKKVLLAEMHHRVKNNLQLIATLLRMQASSDLPPAATQALKSVGDRVHSMALLHNLLHTGEDVSAVPMAAFLQSLVGYLQHAYGRADVCVRTEAVHALLPVDRAVPCALLAHELIANCLKHAFPHGRAGKVLVSLRRSEGKWLLEVLDDGCGLPAGVSPESAETLGFSIVRALAGQLRADLRVEALEGTCVRLAFQALDSGKVAPG